ncbi:MAG: copper resistance protein CopC [Actinomycetota bacterium]|nr:copper resistance protein CopC [Actinomycetota bacterium]
MSHPRHTGNRAIRRAWGLLGAMIAAGILLVAAAPAASAHATLLFTSPAADSAVPVSPTAITLTFNQSVTLQGTPVSLTGAGGGKIALGPARQASGRSVVTVPVTGRLSDGVYTVTWQVISADGDLVGSQYRFAVGPAPASLASVPAAEPSVPGQWPTAILRWLLFAALAGSLGGLAGLGVARLYRGRRDPAPLPPPWALRSSLLGAVAAAGLAAVILGGGNPWTGVAHFSVPRLLDGGAGVITAVEFASFLAAAVLLRLRRPAWAVIPLLAVVAAEGLRAHPDSVVPAGGAMLTWAHLLAAALWTGMLFYVVRAALAWRADPAAVRGLIGLYARAAAWLFAVVVVTGVISALVLVQPLSDLVTTGYGRVLIIKSVLVAVAAALALAGRLWLRRRPEPGAGPALASRVEAGTLAGVLAVAALLSTFAAPSLAAAGGALPFPPPASGPLVPLGGRAGEVGIYGTASAGQIVLNLAAPQENGAGAPQFTVSVTLAGRHGTAAALPVRGCGPGCFVAPARWARGENLVTIRAAASGWTGGTTSLNVPWPPAAGEPLLRRALAALSQVPAMTVYEQVTSDTALGPGAIHAIGISGPQFVAGEPYAGGLAPVADLVTGTGGQQILLLGFPGDGIWAQLTLGARHTPYQDAGDLIAHEILTDPDHLISRGFSYGS